MDTSNAVIYPGDMKRGEFCRIQGGRLDGKYYRIPDEIIQYVLKNGSKQESEREDFSIVQDSLCQFQSSIIKDVLNNYKGFSIAAPEAVDKVIDKSDAGDDIGHQVDIIDLLWAALIMGFRDVMADINRRQHKSTEME